MDEISEEEIEEVTEEKSFEDNLKDIEADLKEKVRDFEDNIIPKLKEGLDNLSKDEEKLYNSLLNKEDVSSTEPEKFSSLKEKIRRYSSQI